MHKSSGQNHYFHPISGLLFSTSREKWEALWPKGCATSCIRLSQTRCYLGNEEFVQDEKFCPSKTDLILQRGWQLPPSPGDENQQFLVPIKLWLLQQVGAGIYRVETSSCQSYQRPHTTSRGNPFCSHQSSPRPSKTPLYKHHDDLISSLRAESSFSSPFPFLLWRHSPSFVLSLPEENSLSSLIFWALSSRPVFLSSPFSGYCTSVRTILHVSSYCLLSQH